MKSSITNAFLERSKTSRRFLHFCKGGKNIVGYRFFKLLYVFDGD